MTVFLSHISEEASEARALGKQLESALPGLKVFVSATDIHLGHSWLMEVHKALERSQATLALCSPNSVRRPWVNFEMGCGWAKGIPVIPVCYKGMRPSQLPDPLGTFHTLELKDARSCAVLVEELAMTVGCQPARDFDYAGMLKSIESGLPTRTDTIGIVLCHQQNKWEDESLSVFSVANGPLSGISDTWTFREITEEKEFLSLSLHTLSGLIFGCPWRSHMTPETITATVEWVKLGGRLLLLGFELGDRHHGSNLGDLSHHFGIYPTTDIVGPSGYGERKPYGDPVDFDIRDPAYPTFTEGLDSLRLSNVQTIRVDPGGVEWLRVGKNSVYQPQSSVVIYRDGTLTAPGGAPFFENQQASWLAVGVQAPKGLCGKGAVQMIGTWDLIGRRESFGETNLAFVTRLFNWLARRST